MAVRDGQVPRHGAIGGMTSKDGHPDSGIESVTNAEESMQVKGKGAERSSGERALRLRKGALAWNRLGEGRLRMLRKSGSSGRSLISLSGSASMEPCDCCRDSDTHVIVPGQSDDDQATAGANRTHLNRIDHHLAFLLIRL